MTKPGGKVIDPAGEIKPEGMAGCEVGVGMAGGGEIGVGEGGTPVDVATAGAVVGDGMVVEAESCVGAGATVVSGRGEVQATVM